MKALMQATGAACLCTSLVAATLTIVHQDPIYLPIQVGLLVLAHLASVDVRQRSDQQ